MLWGSGQLVYKGKVEFSVNVVYSYGDRLVVAGGALGGAGFVNVFSSSFQKITEWNECTTVCSLSFHERGGDLQIGIGNGNIQIYSCQSFNHKQTLDPHTARVIRLLLWNERNILFSASHDSTVGVWDCSSYQCIQILTHHSHITSLAVCNSNSILYSGSRDETIVCWDTTSWHFLKTLNTAHAVGSLNIWNNRLVAGEENGSISVYDTNTHEKLHTLWAHSYPIVFLSVFHNWLCSASIFDFTVKLFNDRFECVTEMQHDNWVASVCAFQGKYIVSSSVGGTLWIWKLGMPSHPHKLSFTTCRYPVTAVRSITTLFLDANICRRND